ncbi:MAG: DeoR/GlpR family DNA-binding transcription regulator [Pseudomonadota bacterium]
MTQAFRQPEILEIARREGRVTVEMLAEHFGVTPQTVRRDLTELADLGKLERVHGGAILPSGVQNIGYANRRALAADAKDRIARACADAIPDEATVFIGIGTTTEAVARALMRHRNLLVVTNNLNVGNTLLENPDCDVIIAGGALRRSDVGLVGALTVRTIEQFKFDHAVLGCSALDEDGDLLDYDIEEVVVNQTIIDRSRSRVLVADATKFERAAPVRIASLRDLDCFFTDAPVPPSLASRCRSWNTEIRICDAP